MRTTVYFSLPFCTHLLGLSLCSLRRLWQRYMSVCLGKRERWISIHIILGATKQEKDVARAEWFGIKVRIGHTRVLSSPASSSHHTSSRNSFATVLACLYVGCMYITWFFGTVSLKEMPVLFSICGSDSSLNLPPNRTLNRYSGSWSLLEKSPLQPSVFYSQPFSLFRYILLCTTFSNYIQV